MIVAEAAGIAERNLIHLTQQIREEFEDAPGLRMTVAEAARFWGLDEETCAEVLARLSSARFLIRGRDGRFEQT